MKKNRKNNLSDAKNSINAKGELLLYGEIGDWWEGLDALSIVQQLEAAAGDEIVIRIHSGGGSVMEGIAMYNRLKQSGKRIVIYIDGVAASMAAFVAMAADVIYIPENALMMFHKPWLHASGHADELRKTADNLDILERSIAMMVADKTGLTVEEVLAMLEPGDDIWMNGIEAVERGFADELISPIEAVASTVLGELKPPPKKFNQLFLTQSAAPIASNPKRKDPMKYKRKTKIAAGGAVATVLAVAAISAQFGSLVTGEVTKEDLLETVATSTGIHQDDIQAILDGKLPSVYAVEATALASALGMSYDDIVETKAAKTSPAAPAAVPGVPADPKATFQALMQEESERKASIVEMGTKASLTKTEIDLMVDTGLSIDDARAATLDILTTRDAGGQPSGTHIRVIAGDNSAMRTAMASAMLNRVDPAKYKIEEANAEFRGMSLLEMSRAMIEYSGSNARGLSRQELAAKALHSTSDFPLIIADVSNKMLRSAYDETPRTFQPIAAQTTAMNFKAKHSLQIGNGEGLEKVNESGEYKYGTLSESDETYKVETFGRIFSFTRQLMMNDDLGALMRFISQVGNLAARKESDIIWGLVKSNPNLSDGLAVFSTNAKRKNLGTGGAVDEAGLSELRKLMRQQKGLDGEYIGITPSYLVVNSERETEAQKVLSAVLAATTGDVNIFQNSLQLIVEERITDTNNPWYTFASPASHPALEYAYLDGQSGPTIETQNGFDVDAVKIKISHDFGAGFVDHRGASKNPGV
ncbi:ATP-dependent Clp protease proteolytic subunit [Porticoccaceae bacterium]|nr:ATP-dependent Clp protease proteolytic subunit [Porticoccaceae bacterium]